MSALKITIELETDDLSILKLIAKAAYVKPERSKVTYKPTAPTELKQMLDKLRTV